MRQGRSSYWRVAGTEPNGRCIVRAGLSQVVVEESGMESWDPQYPLSAFPGPP